MVTCNASGLSTLGVELCETENAPHERRLVASGPVSPAITAKVWVDALSRDDCLNLLAVARIGRVGVHTGALPAIFPVDYALTANGIVFPTTRDGKLAAATNAAVVAFQADDAEPEQQSGWSVMVVGVAKAIAEARELAAARALPLRGLATANADHYVRISVDLVSGWRMWRSEPV